MQLALDASVAEAVSPPGAASTDTIIFPECNAASHQRSRIAEIPASWRPNVHLKHAPPDLLAAGAVSISFVKSSDAESARRFLDAISLLRQWGRESLITVESTALEAVAS